MATETLHSQSQPSNAAAQPELLVSAVLHLMSHYNAARTDEETCTKLAPVIERHLKVLADLPDVTPVLRATCRQLSGQWSDVAEKTMRAPAKRNFFHRLVAGPRLD